jgi:protein-disulfide isomerase
MLVRKIAWAICLATPLLLLHSPVLAADAEDPSSLKRAIEALKAGQQEIAKDLAEIKRLLQSSRAPQRRRQTVEDVNVVMDVAQEPFQGDANAPLTLVEMTDFQCPFCGRHVKSRIPEIMKNYVSTGKLRYVVRDFPLPFHKDARKAAEAAHCAGDQGRYWEMHDLLFANQQALGADRLVAYAARVGLDTIERQRPRRGEARGKLAQAAGRGVARVGEFAAGFLEHALVEPGKSGLGDKAISEKSHTTWLVFSPAFCVATTVT